LKTRLVWLGILAAFVAGCTTSLNLPSVTEAPTNQTLAGKVVWRDLITSRPADARKFYSELFGWQFQDLGLDLGFGNTLNYSLIRHQGRLVGGMVDANRLDDIREDNIDQLSQWVVLMSVADADAAVAAVQAAGGKVLTPPTDFVDRGRLSLVEDSQGATLALLETRDGDPADQPPVINGFLWAELWTLDTAKASDFYQQVTGLEPASRSLDNGMSYRYLSSGGIPRVGLLKRPIDDIEPVWVSYVRVADVAATAARVEALGGRILAGPQPRDLGGEVALIADPSGAGIAIQTWMPPEQRAANTE
jgi:predicted enzyme related to lactoylglutathione lyase